MTKQNSRKHSVSGVGRRELLQSAAALLSMPFIQVTSASAQEKLAGSGEVVAFSYGGSWTDGLRRYVYEPFTKATDITVVNVTADAATTQLMAMSKAGRMDWDIAYLGHEVYPAMREAGLFEPIDYGLWNQESLEGVPPDARLKDAVGLFQWAQVLAYDQRAFPKGGRKIGRISGTSRNFRARVGLRHRSVGIPSRLRCSPPVSLRRTFGRSPMISSIARSKNSTRSSPTLPSGGVLAEKRRNSWSTANTRWLPHSMGV